MGTQKSLELKLLKAILWIYILLCFIIAGLNYGYASHASAKSSEFIAWFWQFYENWIKTLFIITCSMLTLRIVASSGRTTLRKRNLLGFTITALVVHIILPLFFNNPELYFMAMPLPWTTTPLQLLYPDSAFYLSRFPLWGVAGITTALIFYGIVSAVVLLGTLLWGRRWQCSTLCLFNGFASEVFAPAIPLVGRKKRMKLMHLKLFSFLQWLFLILSLFFTFYWVLRILGVPLIGDPQLISKVETYKYLSGELLMAMFFWVVFFGRSYCYYCPLGTVLGVLGKVAGQKIVTNQSKCLKCSRCNQACPMSIDIKTRAQFGEPIASLRCVGCGHCVDACPTKNLAYTTKFSSNKPFTNYSVDFRETIK